MKRTDREDVLSSSASPLPMVKLGKIWTIPLTQIHPANLHPPPRHPMCTYATANGTPVTLIDLLVWKLKMILKMKTITRAYLISTNIFPSRTTHITIL
ncbi:hypothetical protein DSO57_1027941 [Entomophthora muscae]|uniref:Uncharacterized protein n=1 Tax=Entomophthora muscae TaxID=34485 RepID=A0ACC2T1N3_9FUNG|nr:hypothetical protein DSO57_1027941 [Entomophthora muscae]